MSSRCRRYSTSSSFVNDSSMFSRYVSMTVDGSGVGSLTAFDASTIFEDPSVFNGSVTVEMSRMSSSSLFVRKDSSVWKDSSIFLPLFGLWLNERFRRRRFFSFTQDASCLLLLFRYQLTALRPAVVVVCCRSSGVSSIVVQVSLNSWSTLSEFSEMLSELSIRL